MALKRVRVPVRFSTGKSIPLGGGSGTTVEQVSQTIVNQSGGLVSSPSNPTAIITWPNVLFVPPSILSPPIPQPTDDPDDALIIPGPIGLTGKSGANAPIIWPDDPDDAISIPGPAGAAGAAGQPGASGMSLPISLQPEDSGDPLPPIPGPAGAAGTAGAAGKAGNNAPIMWPDDIEDPLQIPGPAGAAGAPGSAGATGATGPYGPPIIFEVQDPDDYVAIPGPQGLQGIQGVPGASGSGGGNASMASWLDWEYPEELPWRDIPQNCDTNVWSAPQVFESTGLNEGAVTIQGTHAFLQFNNSTPGVIAQLGTYEGWLGSGSDSTDFAVGAINNLYLFADSATSPSFAVFGTAAPTIKGWGPIAAGLVDMTPDTGTFTITYTGMTTAVTGTAVWSRNGNNVTLFFPAATGTSNSTSMTATGLPATLAPARAQAHNVPSFSLETGGAIPTTDANDISIATSGTVTFYLNGSATGFGSTLTKGVSTGFTVPYLLN